VFHFFLQTSYEIRSQYLLNTFYIKSSHVCSVKVSYYSGIVVNHIQKKPKDSNGN